MTMNLIDRKKKRDLKSSNAAASNDDDDSRANNTAIVEPMRWREDPEMSASFLSGITFQWIQPMFTRATLLRKKDLWLEHADLAPLATMDRTENVEKMFRDAYDGACEPKEENKNKKNYEAIQKQRNAYSQAIVKSNEIRRVGSNRSTITTDDRSSNGEITRNA